MYHIITESVRAQKFKDACAKNDVAAIGKLMDESYASCKEKYDSTVQEIDELVKTCKMNGALGAKMTGPGWGGCVISLVESSKVPEFVKNVEKVFGGFFLTQEEKNRAIVLYERKDDEIVDDRGSIRMFICFQTEWRCSLIQSCKMFMVLIIIIS